MGEGGWWFVVGFRCLVLSVGTATQQGGQPNYLGIWVLRPSQLPGRDDPTDPTRPDRQIPTQR